MSQHPPASDGPAGQHTPVGQVSSTPPPVTEPPVPPSGTAGPIVQPKKRRKRGIVIGALSAVAAVATTAEMTIGAVSFVTSLGGSDDDEPEFRDVSAIVAPHTLEGIEPALDAVRDEIGHEPALRSIWVHPDRIRMTVQVPDDPELLDEYTWRDDDEGLSRPAPYEHFLEPGRLPEFLFTAEDISTDAMAAALEDLPSRHPDQAQHPEAELVASTLRLSKEVSAGEHDQGPQLNISVHADDNVVDSGRSWIITYDRNGEHERDWEAGDLDDEDED